MALYEIKRNAENKVALDDVEKKTIVSGSQPVVEAILKAILAKHESAGRTVAVAFDGWYGVDWPAIVDALEKAAQQAGKALQFESINQAALDAKALEAYKQPYLTDDPAFGLVNTGGTIGDLMEPERLGTLRDTVRKVREGKDGPAAVVVYGPGAAVEALDEMLDLRFYFDVTRQPLLWQMWDGKLVPFGASEPDPDYFWKEYYYCDFYLLDRQKEHLTPCMDFWLEAISFDGLKMMPRATYDRICQELVHQPIKEVNIIQPGPWGAYRYREIFDVPGLGCNAWHELAGPELSVLVDCGLGECINFPFMNLMRHAELLVGPAIATDFPGLFPLDVWLDDGYFPEPTPAERTSMPIHNHPSTDYVRQHFKEPLGRYETYYICEAYEGANTWHGFTEDADLEEWERLCRKSNNIEPIENWKEFIQGWPTNVGDLFLIPPGTTHGHGGNQMVLEMDTCPSIAGTEYSFFMYDFARNTWDEETKTMSSKPCRMHLDHGFATEKWVRADYSEKRLQAKPRVVSWTQDCRFDRYTSDPRMPFEIERFHFDKRAENDTKGHWMHIITLTVGQKATIRSLDDPAKETTILKFQSAVIPACFGRYEMINDDGATATIVQLRWKK